MRQGFFNRIKKSKCAYIIAEAGVNHNGNIKLGEKLIDEAKKCGADAVKFQTFKASKIAVRSASKAAYQKKLTDPNESQYEMLKRLELKKQDFKHLKNICKKNKITFLSTPYNYRDVDFLCDLGVETIKLASMHLVEIPFLVYVAKKNIPIILSTGMATLGEVDDAINTIINAGNNKIILLQCTTDYPTKPEEANLRVIENLKRLYPFPVGYSDHTEGNLAACLAVGYGAQLLEKHFTLDREMEGPDHKSSLDPMHFKLFVEQVRLAELLKGETYKKPTESEIINKTMMRRSLVLNKNKKRGEIIRETDIDFMRPADGIPVKELFNVIGRKLIKSRAKWEMLSYDDF